MYICLGTHIVQTNCVFRVCFKVFSTGDFPHRTALGDAVCSLSLSLPHLLTFARPVFEYFGYLFQMNALS